MQAITRKVRREAPGPRRPIIITLEPGEEPTIEVREKGRRSGYRIPVRSLYTVLAQRAADNALALRRLRRRGGAR